MACNNKIHSNKAAVAPTHRRCNDDDPVQKQHRSLPCTSARKGYVKLMKDGGVEDPFVAAYRDCAIEDDQKNYKLQKNKNGFGGWSNLFGNLSCKQLTAVRDDSLISSPLCKPSIKDTGVKDYNEDGQNQTNDLH